MKQFPALFRYSGNKRKIVPLLRRPPRHKRLVEGYLGSGSFILRYGGPALGMDINEDIVELWRWLKDEATPKSLRELRTQVDKLVEETEDHKPDVRELNLARGPETYVRVNCSGVYAGQLSSWILYPQHKLPVDQTVKLLSMLEDIEVEHGNAESYQEQDGDVLFLDPPYIGTSGNYKEQAKSGIEEGYSPQQTIDLISRVECPVILTYGDGAPDIFPDYEWEVVLTRKVPRIRTGGTLERTEYVSYINWAN